jgi:hypothetical protein
MLYSNLLWLIAQVATPPLLVAGLWRRWSYRGTFNLSAREKLARLAFLLVMGILIPFVFWYVAANSGPAKRHSPTTILIKSISSWK